MKYYIYVTHYIFVKTKIYSRIYIDDGKGEIFRNLRAEISDIKLYIRAQYILSESGGRALQNLRGWQKQPIFGMPITAVFLCKIIEYAAARAYGIGEYRIKRGCGRNFTSRGASRRGECGRKLREARNLANFSGFSAEFDRRNKIDRQSLPAGRMENFILNFYLSNIRPETGIKITSNYVSTLHFQSHCKFFPFKAL